MAEFRPGSGLTRLHVLRVEVDGEVREVTSNLSLQDVADLGRGERWLVRLAREYGRPVPVEDVAS